MNKLFEEELFSRVDLCFTLCISLKNHFLAIFKL